MQNISHETHYYAIINKLVKSKRKLIYHVELGVSEVIYKTGLGHRITYAFLFEKARFTVNEAKTWLLKHRYRFEWEHQHNIEVNAKFRGEDNAQSKQN
jgi:hypothetical protein